MTLPDSRGFWFQIGVTTMGKEGCRYDSLAATLYDSAWTRISAYKPWFDDIFKATGNVKLCEACKGGLLGKGPCDSQATCSVAKARAASPSAVCTCKSPWKGNGTSCELVRKCAINNGGCPANSVCRNRADGRRVCTCKAGFITDDSDTRCLSNPCLKNNGGCPMTTTCSAEVVRGEVQKECKCPRGTDFFSPLLRLCVPRNRCNFPDKGGCGLNTICIPSVVWGFRSCRCKDGFVGVPGKGKGCIVDPCKTNNGRCSSNAFCLANDRGQVRCICKPGFLIDPVTSRTCIPATNGTYLPVGVQYNVPVAQVTAGGWKQCYQDRYSDIFDFTESFQACTQDKIMLACRQSTNTTFQLLAWGKRSAVFPSNPLPPWEGNFTSRVSNNVQFYAHQGHSIGFGMAANTSVFSLTSCDNPDWGSAQRLKDRLCWRLSEGGWRCGSAVWLNSASDWERAIFQAN